MLDSLTKEQKFVLLGLIFAIIVGLSVSAYRQFASPNDRSIKIEDPPADMKTVEAGDIFVHLSGAIRREGVYRLKAGDRVMDAIRLAGGAAGSADLSAVNLAEKLQDGQKITNPAKQRPILVAGSVPAQSTSSPDGKINLNTADEKALDSLPGVGLLTAKAIVEYRKTNGPFSKPEQIMEIPRFGKSKYEKIKDKITI